MPKSDIISTITIRPIARADYRQAHAFQCEYLDQEAYDAFVARVAAHPALYGVAYDESALVGVVYGDPSPRQPSAVTLQGIAVDLNAAHGYARRGIGSALLRHFESQAADLGFLGVGVGSAEDLKVEHFYLRNGYVPIEVVAKTAEGEELARMPVDNYEAGNRLREAMRRKHRPHEVIWIFEKLL